MMGPNSGLVLDLDKGEWVKKRPIKRDSWPIVDNSQWRRDIFLNTRLVESSNVAWIGWPVDGEKAMYVKFANGGFYRYIGVSRQRAVAAAYAVSVGHYINERIKPHFEVEKLR